MLMYGVKWGPRTMRDGATARRRLFSHSLWDMWEIGKHKIYINGKLNFSAFQQILFLRAPKLITYL